MREIKFRVWDVYGKQWCKMVEVDVIQDFRYVIDNKDLVFQQFTGLKDINNKEVYEGDIVRYNFGNDEKIEWIDLVIFDHYSWRLAHYDGLESGCTSLFPLPGLEVIGNIFENKNLLK